MWEILAVGAGAMLFLLIGYQAGCRIGYDRGWEDAVDDLLPKDKDGNPIIW